MRVSIRPVIVVSACVSLSVTLAGGLIQYYSALDAVSSALDKAGAQDAAMFAASEEQGTAALREAVRRAHDSLRAGVDESSNADVLLLTSQVQRPFASAELAAREHMWEVEMIARTATTVEDVFDRIQRSECARVRAQMESNHGLVSGMGTDVIQRRSDGPRYNHSAAALFFATFCWYEYPPGSEERAWYGLALPSWDNDTEVPDWLLPYVYLNGTDDAFDPGEQFDAGHWLPERPEADWWEGGDVDSGKLVSGVWSDPMVWWVGPAPGSDAAPTTYQYVFYVVRWPIDIGVLSQTYGVIYVETNLIEWGELVDAWKASSNAKGSFFVADLVSGLAFTHSSEPVPDRASTQECQDGETVSIEGLGLADSAACFPRLEHYSAVTQFAARSLAPAGYDTLINVTHGSTEYYLRKHQLKRLGGSIVLDVCWFRDSADIQQELERAEAELRADLAATAAAAQALNDQHMSSLRASAEDDIDTSLAVMVALLISAAVFSAVVSAMWVVLLANPLVRLRAMVMLMGGMKIEEALEQHNSEGKQRCEVGEVRDLKTGFGVAAQYLMEWRDNEFERRRQLEKEQRERIEKAVLSADENVNKLVHPMVLIRADAFLTLEKLEPYEVLRDQGKAAFIDTDAGLAEFRSRHVIIFLSHQWLAWGRPDPDSVHYRTMSRAIQQAVRRIGPKELSDRSTEPMSNVYIWVDFCSIAQQHRGMQILAVSSLPVWASQSDAFIVIAPPAKHANSWFQCSLQSYNLRGWCRAEMLAKMCGSGLENFYVIKSVDGELEEASAEWLDSLSLHVFDGEFSCCACGHQGTQICDRETLMPAVLGLYSLILKQKKGYAERGEPLPPHLEPVVRRIEKDKARFFPASFRFVSCDGWEESRELFGPLIEEMEKHIHQPDKLVEKRRASRMVSPASPPEKEHKAGWTANPLSSAESGYKGVVDTSS